MLDVGVSVAFGEDNSIFLSEEAPSDLISGLPLISPTLISLEGLQETE